MSPARALRFAFLALALSGCASAPTSSPEDRRRIAELEEENALLQGRIDALEESLRGVLESNGDNWSVCPTYPPIDGTVLDVKPELDLVVLDKGEMDGVKLDYVFDVYRGTTYRGQVRITGVQERMSTGKILFTKSPIDRGDSATTQL